MGVPFQSKFRQIRKRAINRQAKGLQIYRPDESTNKKISQ